MFTVNLYKVEHPDMQVIQTKLVFVEQPIFLQFHLISSVKVMDKDYLTNTVYVNRTPFLPETPAHKSTKVYNPAIPASNWVWKLRNSLTRTF